MVRRLARYSLNALTLVSLLLCAATVGLWVRSYWRTDLLTVNWVDDPRDGLHWRAVVIRFASSCGRFRVDADDDRLYPDRSERREGWMDDSRREFPPGAHLVVVAGRYDLSDGEIKRGPWDRLGICWCSPADDIRVAGRYYTQRITSVLVPHALLLAVCASFPSLSFGVHTANWLRQRRRSREGRCLSCGYDMRATRDRCPECGTAAKGDVIL